MYHTVRYWVRHYLTPHESNNWRAKSLHPYAVGFYVLLLLVIQTQYGLMTMRGPGVLGYATNISVDRILELVNSERKKEGLSPVSLHPQLSTAAQKKAEDMFAKNYWAHVSPTGQTPWYFITNAGYNYLFAGENLAKSFDTSDQVVTAWMRSPTHRANILKPHYTDMGLAVSNGRLVGEDTTLVVQEFGAQTLTREEQATPVVAQAEPEVAHEVLQEPVPIVVPQVASQISESSASLPLWYRFPRTLSLLLAEVMLFVLCLDALYIWRHRMSRVGSHTLAHIIFFLALIGAMGAAGAGAIL